MKTLFPIMGPTRLQEQRALEQSGAPILKAIPWSMLEPHEKQALKNHDQTLLRLAERGGLSACEAVAVLEDRPWRNMSDVDASRRLHELFVAAADAE